jgi:hypothetical protein
LLTLVFTSLSGPPASRSGAPRAGDIDGAWPAEANFIELGDNFLHFGVNRGTPKGRRD